MAHVKYDMGEMGREEWNNTVSTRLCIVIWSQRPQVEEKNALFFFLIIYIYMFLQRLLFRVACSLASRITDCIARLIFRIT